MTDIVSTPPSGETPVNPYSLLEAVNRSSDTAHMAWLIFLAIMAYLILAVAGVTHRDLLLETPVSLPILDVNIQLAQFFQFAPIVLVLFHLGVVSQLVLLARKTLEFDSAIRLLESTDRRTHPLRLELHNFSFVQAIAGPTRSVVMGGILHAMSWLTLAILPVVLILYIQVVFLPYHSGWITWTHRIALVFDISILVFIGVFLMRVETSFFQALWRTTIAHPISFLVTFFVFGMVTIFSFFFATVPGETLDRISQTVLGQKQQDAGSGQNYNVGFMVPFLTAGDDGLLFGIFRRNIVVTDTDLVVDRHVSKGEPTVTLRGRDLRFAKLDRTDLHQADLTGSNLNYASLKGTNLSDAWLQCGDVNELRLSGTRKNARCTTLQNADLSGAVLTKANLTGADAQNAKFEETKLQRANLSFTLLAGANFSSARLDMADLTGGIEAQGANFLFATLQGADLTGAKLQAADFRSATMQGAVMDFAHLQGAVLQFAQMGAATLRQAKLHGADFGSADITAVDFREAKVFNAKPPATDPKQLADLEQISYAAPSEDDVKKLKAMLDGYKTDSALWQQLNDALKPLLNDEGKNTWTGSNDELTWQSMASTGYSAVPQPQPQPVSAEGDPAATEPAQPTPVTFTSSYGSRLTEYLIDLACRAQWADGAVATGIIRRAKQEKFRGNLVTIYDKLKSKTCPASKSIPADEMQDLSVAADRR